MINKRSKLSLCCRLNMCSVRGQSHNDAAACCSSLELHAAVKEEVFRSFTAVKVQNISKVPHFKNTLLLVLP